MMEPAIRKLARHAHRGENYIEVSDVRQYVVGGSYEIARNAWISRLLHWGSGGRAETVVVTVIGHPSNNPGGTGLTLRDSLTASHRSGAVIRAMPPTPENWD